MPLSPPYLSVGPGGQASSSVTTERMAEKYSTFLNAQNAWVATSRKYRPSPWVAGLLNARSTWLNFDYWWDRTLGERIIHKDLEHKQPPVSLLEVSRLEVDTMIAYRESMKKVGVDPSITASTSQALYKAEKLAQVRAADQVYVDVINKMNHHMHHVYGMPPAHGLSLIMKYVVIGTITGTALAAVWRYGFHLPERRKIDAFYKSLYADHPEFWPALAMQQKKHVRPYLSLSLRDHTNTHLRIEAFFLLPLAHFPTFLHLLTS